MIQSWEKLVMEGQADGQTNRRTDGSGFIGWRCTTNVERPKVKTWKKKITYVVYAKRTSENWVTFSFLGVNQYLHIFLNNLKNRSPFKCSQKKKSL